MRLMSFLKLDRVVSDPREEKFYEIRLRNNGTTFTGRIIVSARPGRRLRRPVRVGRNKVSEQLQPNRFSSKQYVTCAARTLLPALLLFFAALFLPVTAAHAQAASPANTQGHVQQPDVQVLVAPGPSGQEMVDLTYPKVITRPQATGDVAAVAKAANVQVGNMEITNSAVTLRGVKPTPMTSATFITQGMLPTAGKGTAFHIEPWIVALRGYPFLAITYLMPPQFAFNGLRSYRSSDVEVWLDQRGATYTYHVHVLNPQLTKLNLPLTQPDMRQTQLAENRQRQMRIRILGLVLVGAVAVAAGYSVYTLLSRLT